MLTDKDFDLVQNYLHDQLNPTDRLAVEERMRNDQVFCNELTEQRQLLQIGIALARRQMLEKINDRLEREKKGEKVYDTTELLQTFMPDRDREQIINIQRSTRGSLPPNGDYSTGIQLLHPTPVLDLKGDVIQIVFELAEPCEVDLLLIVVNNNKKPLKEKIIHKGAKKWEITLGTKKKPLEPGVYYWEIQADLSDVAQRTKYGIVQGKIFKDQHLLPDRYQKTQ